MSQASGSFNFLKVNIEPVSDILGYTAIKDFDVLRDYCEVSTIRTLACTPIFLRSSM